MLQYLQKNQPQRYEVIANKVNSAGRMVQQFALQQQHQQIALAQQAQAQQAKQQQDDLFSKNNPHITGERVSELGREAMSMLRETGLTARAVQLCPLVQVGRDAANLG